MNIRMTFFAQIWWCKYLYFIFISNYYNKRKMENEIVKGVFIILNIFKMDWTKTTTR